jgi:hypothetical protein
MSKLLSFYTLTAGRLVRSYESHDVPQQCLDLTLQTSKRTLMSRAMEHVLSLSAIRARIGALNDEILKSQRELEDLAAAERMVLRFGSTDEQVPPTPIVHHLRTASVATAPPAVGSPSLSSSPNILKNLTNLILVAMRQTPSLWMTAEEVRVRASDLKGSDIPKGSIAPTLWNLKNSGLIVRNGLKVALKSRLEEQGQLPGNAPDEPVPNEDSDLIKVLG